MAGAIYDRRYLAESVVFPSKIAPGTFRLVLVRTRDGAVRSGMVRKETPEELVLVDPDGKAVSIRKAAIEARRLGDLSLMPEGLVAGLTLQEFADLVAYLESLKGD
jgi:putative heme-binding domain-containing protein